MRPAPLLLAAVLALPALLHAAPAPTPAANASAGEVAAIRNFYRAGVERNGIVGGTLVLIDRGEVVLDERYGQQSLTPPQPVDEHTTYHWASVTKTLTGIAIMQLRDRGLLSLDESLTKYIPELNAVHDPFGPVSAITIREAMSHSSGFRDATWPWRTEEWQPFEPTEWSQIVAMLPYTSVDFAPGSRYRYSNLAVVFLGEIIERLGGDTFEVYMQKNVLGPLGMSHSYYDRSPATALPFRSHSWDRKDGKLTEDLYDFDTGITRSNGGLNAPLSDMLLYLRFLVGEPKRNVPQEPDYDRILKRSSLEEMWRPILPVPPDEDFPSRPGGTDEVAASFFLHTDRGVRLVGHPGWQNGFRSQLNFDPLRHRGYLVVYNTDAQDPLQNAVQNTAQNTRSFNIDLRDYLIDHFFTLPAPEGLH
jgi:CubicO group peptidase (beta-lactamase class C family)